MVFHFKQKSHDFRVSENLPFELKGKGDAFYVYFEKRNITTHKVITHLRKKFNISRLTLGIAGLKDKKAVAKQWISIYDRALKQLGGEKAFVNALKEIVRVLETGRHPFPLNLSTPITNTFHIKFKATKNLGQDERIRAKEIVQQMLDEGYPNIFGDQRFGINGRNSTQGRELATGNSKEKFNKVETVFKLQAYVSKLFNELVETRAEQNIETLDGDMLTWSEDGKVYYGYFSKKTNMVELFPIRSDSKAFSFSPVGTGKMTKYDPAKMQITLPIPGYNLALPPAESEAGKRERETLQRLGRDEKKMGIFQERSVYGLRRPIRVTPTGAKVRYNKDDLQVDFTLPSGSYASIVFDKLDELLVSDEE